MVEPHQVESRLSVVAVLPTQAACTKAAVILTADKSPGYHWCTWTCSAIADGWQLKKQQSRCLLTRCDSTGLMACVTATYLWDVWQGTSRGCGVLTILILSLSTVMQTGVLWCQVANQHLQSCRRLQQQHHQPPSCGYELIPPTSEVVKSGQAQCSSCASVDAINTPGWLKPLRQAGAKGGTYIVIHTT